MLRQSKQFDVEKIGTLHFVLGQSPDLRRLYLQPFVSLPEGSYVLLAVLEVANDILFGYQCLRNSANRSSAIHSHGFSALRAWCGCTSDNTSKLDSFFGPTGLRNEQITHAQECLGKTFSQEQRDILNTLDGDFSAINCV